MKTAGLSIDGRGIGVSIVEKTFLRTVKPVKTMEIVPAEGQNRAEGLRENLLRWKKEYSITHVSFGLDFRHFTHHIVELPLKRHSEIKLALPFELEKRLPLPPEEYVTDFEVIETTDAGSRSLVLALKKDGVEWIFDSIEETGIKLVTIKCSFIEALNAFLETERQKDALVLYPSEGMVYMAGIRNSRPVMLRSVVEDRLSDEVEKVSWEFGGRLYSLARSGAVEKLGPVSLSYSVPGLVAASAKGGRPLGLDFVPEERLPRRVDYYPHAIAAMSAVCVALFFLTSVVSYQKDRAALDGITARTAEIKKQVRGITEIKRKFEDTEAKRRFLEDFRGGANLPIRALGALSSTVPSSAWLTSFSVDEKMTVDIQGFAESTPAVIEAIERSGLFRNITYSAPVTTKDGLEQFALRMEIGR